MDYAMQISRPGGPEALHRIDLSPLTPSAGEILIRHEAIGLNFVDIYHRKGLYPLQNPNIPGVEGAGTIEAVGSEVDELFVGQRVAYAGLTGGYSTKRLLPAWRALPLPDSISFQQAAASLLRGFTAHMLLNRVCSVNPRSVVLVHAAAGGLGTVLTRWIKQIGGTVIGVVGSDEKAEIAKDHGADEVIVGRDHDIASTVAMLTRGLGCDFAIDGIGGTMLAQTLRCVRNFGTVASIGEAGGPIPPIPAEALGPIHPINLSRPSVMAYTAELDTYGTVGREVLVKIQSGIEAFPGSNFPLIDVAKAHAALESGSRKGSMILIP